jgi:glucose dehydrogenase
MDKDYIMAVRGSQRVTMRTQYAVVLAGAQTDGTGGMSYSPLKQITPANVAKRQVAWSLDT